MVTIFSSTDAWVVARALSAVMTLAQPLLYVVVGYVFMIGYVCASSRSLTGQAVSFHHTTSGFTIVRSCKNRKKRAYRASRSCELIIISCRVPLAVAVSTTFNISLISHRTTHDKHHANPTIQSHNSYARVLLFLSLSPLCSFHRPH